MLIFTYRLKGKKPQVATIVTFGFSRTGFNDV